MIKLQIKSADLDRNTRGEGGILYWSDAEEWRLEYRSGLETHVVPTVNDVISLLEHPNLILLNLILLNLNKKDPVGALVAKLTR